MKTKVDRYLILKRAIQDWILGHGTLCPIADQLNVTATSLKEGLFQNGLADINGNLKGAIDVQDIFNFIFLAYTLSNRQMMWRKGS